MKLLAFCVTWSALIGQSYAEEIKIGVRVDARPFSYCKQTRASGCGEHLDQYGGYFISLCRGVLDDMRLRSPDLNVTVVEVTAGDRFKKLVDKEVDFLCGADTITEDRLNDYAFSLPIYVTGISIAWRKGDADNRGCNASGASSTAVVGMVGNTTAQSEGIDLMLGEGEFGQFADAVKQAEDIASGGKIKCSEDKVGKNGGSKYAEILRAYPDHREGLKKFCDGDVKYYIADREILLFASQCVDNMSVSERTYSYDRYGLVFRKPNAASPSDYKLFAEVNYSLQKLSWGPRSILVESALSEMPNYRLSPDLQQFYRSVSGVAFQNHP